MTRRWWFSRATPLNRYRFLAMKLLLVCVVAAAAAAPGSGHAATILKNARVVVEAGAAAVPLEIAVQGEKIAFVGTAPEARRRFPGAEEIDLSGAVVYPGFSDTHGHLAGLGMSLESVDLKNLTSAKGCADRMGRHSVPPGVWVEGQGWDQNLWTPKQFPDASDLDAVLPDRPAFASRIDGHAVWVNSAAMKAAGIARDTPDPPGGRILRRADGSPSGVFIDNAMEAVMHARPGVSAEAARRYFRQALSSCASMGLTEVGDASGYGAQEIAVLREMAARGELPIRVFATVGAAGRDLEGFLSKGPTSHGLLAVRAVKIYADGALGSRGASLLADYSDDPGNRGLMVTPPAAIESIAERCFRAGFQVWIHAIGDAANRSVLDAIEMAERAVHPKDPRPRIEHAQVVAPEDRKRFAALGVIASIQPSFATSDMPWAEARLSKSRVGESYAWKSLEKAGAKLAGGSDFPVESNDPRLGIYAAVTREDVHGNPPGGWRPEEDLSRDDAIALYTRNAAYALFEERTRGSIAVGKMADFTVFDRDLAHCPAAEIPRARVVLTMAAGKVAFRAP
jgi:predicted amidohydrolase YtcJ